MQRPAFSVFNYQALLINCGKNRKKRKTFFSVCTMTVFVFLLLLPFRSKFLAPPREQRPFNDVGEIKGNLLLNLFSPLKGQHDSCICTAVHSFTYSFSEHLLSAYVVSGNSKIRQKQPQGVSSCRQTLRCWCWPGECRPLWEPWRTPHTGWASE